MQAGRHEKIVEPVQRWGKSPSERRGYLKERNLFAIRRILVILGARAVLMPLAPVREARLAPALDARYNGKFVLRCRKGGSGRVEGREGRGGKPSE